jgi:hypothetical protein
MDARHLLIQPRGVRAANLGTFDTKEEAAAAYDSGSRLHFKQNAFCNYATQMDAEEAMRLRGGARRGWGAVATSSLPARRPVPQFHYRALFLGRLWDWAAQKAPQPPFFLNGPKWVGIGLAVAKTAWKSRGAPVLTPAPRSGGGASTV